MNGESENPESSSGRFLQTVRPQRDLETNWTVDLAKNLEEYLLKICSGQISGNEDTIFSVNFAEAALLLQGSVQVYSRKVEYLYSLVVHALNFISKKSQEEDQEPGTSAKPESSRAHSAKDEGDDSFWGLDDIPVEAKNLLDATGNNTPFSPFVRPPANLVVLEGECLDVGGDAGELESYLLATSDLYRDFILLDSIDAVVVDSFLDSKAGKGPPSVNKGNSVTSRGRKSFLSPLRSALKSAQKKNDADILQSPCVDQIFEPNNENIGCSSPAFDFSADRNNDFGMADAYSGMDDFDDDDVDEEDDPWKPLNPHEPGNLKVKPYKKVRAKLKLDVGSRKNRPLATEFPLAKLIGPISNELTEIWEAKLNASEKDGTSQSLPLYEKLRQTLVLRETKTNDAFFSSPENNYQDNGYDSDPDMGPHNFDMPDDFDMPDKNNDTYNAEDIPPFQEKGEDQDAHENLDDLCRSHLDSLLATLAENEKQTEMAARVSTWKQRIEQNLEEQDARPSFDIHKYGDRVLDKLSTKGENGHALSFTDVVKGQEKHDVARTFSALLQLVNNGDVDLVRSSTTDTSPVCYTNVAPFYVRRLKNEKKGGFPLHSSKKRAKSPLMKGNPKPKNNKGKENCPNSSPDSNHGLSMNLGKGSRARCTPQGKKRRKSRLVAPLEMNFVG